MGPATAGLETWRKKTGESSGVGEDLMEVQVWGGSHHAGGCGRGGGRGEEPRRSRGPSEAGLEEAAVKGLPQGLDA